MREIDLSIIIPSFRSEKTIKACLQSVLEQTAKKSFEVIVVDSSPGEEVDGIVKLFSSVQFIKMAQKTVSGSARNLGAQKAFGKVLVFLDASMSLGRGALDQIWACYEQGKSVFSGALELSPDNRALASCVDHYLFFHEYQKTRKPGLRGNLPGTLLVIDKDLFTRYGGFGDYARAQDTEFTVRMTRAGEKLFFVPSIVAYRSSNASLKSICRNNFVFGEKWFRIYFPGASFWERCLFALVLPALSFLKSIRIILRNLFYNTPQDKLGSFFLSPLLIALGFFWMAGIYKGLFRTGLEEKDAYKDVVRP